MDQGLNKLQNISLIFIFGFLPLFCSYGQDLNIGQESYTIPKDSVEEFQNVNLNSNSSILTVNGTLIVNGNLEMSGNQSQLIMGPEARVVIYGDFLSSNSVTLTARSYLVIYGNFINKTPNSKATLNVEKGNIYIFGTVDNWGDEFRTCENYTGDTGAIENENCDYGTKDDFDDNADDFPDDLKEILPCISNYTWTGETDADWNNPLNWSCEKVPGLSTNVTIPVAAPVMPVLQNGADGQVQNITVEAGASLTVLGKKLSIAGELNVLGELNAQGGKIEFVGSKAQVIPNMAFLNNQIEDLIIQNGDSLTSNASLKISNSLKINSGTFSTGNGLTLLSSASGTAYIDGSGAGQVIGNVTMQRYLDNAFGYKYFSSPFKNSTVSDLADNFELTDPVTGFPHLYEYVEKRKDALGNDLTGWQKYLEFSAPLAPGSGYAINPGGTPGPLTLQLTGEVNNGPVEVTVENNNGDWTNGFNLVGNPYPSGIDWNIIATSLNGIDNAIYFFKASANDRYTGTYTSYVDGISTDGRSSSIIPSMQGFFVRVSDPNDGNYPATATLQFNNNARVGNQTSQPFYKAQKKAGVQKIRLTAKFRGEETSDATVLYFKNGASTDFEREFDAQKLLNTAVDVPSLYSLTSAKEKLAINGMSMNGTQEIPIGITSARSGEMILTLSGIENIFMGLKVYLKDQKKGVVQNLLEMNSYSFTSQKGEINDRFFLILSSEGISQEDLEKEMEAFTVEIDKGEIWVMLNLPENASGNVILSTTAGQILYKSSGKGKEELSLGKFNTPGVYLVSLKWAKGITTKKLLFKK